MANDGIRGMQRKLKELRDIRSGLTDPSAKARVADAIARVENNIGKRANKIGRRPRMRRGVAS